jgi:uncharacterized protein (TIGR02996 family)
MPSTVNDEELGFHEGMDKGDETALGAFADWLEEHDDPRAEGYRFLRDKGVIPELPDKTRAPWTFGPTNDRQEEINKLDAEKRLAFRVSCVLAALHDAESVLHLFEASFPGDCRPRQVIESVKQWAASPTRESRAAVNRAIAAALQAEEDVRQLLGVIEGAREVAVVCSAIDAAHTVIAHSESYAADEAATASQSAKCAVMAVPMDATLYPMAECRWRWIDCVFQHLILIPNEWISLADKFVRSLPLQVDATRREITDAFAMAFVGSP